MNEPVTIRFNDERDVIVDEADVTYGCASFAMRFSAATSTGRATRRGIILSLTPSLRSRVDIAETVLRERPVAATTSATFVDFCQFFTKASYEYGADFVLPLPLVLDI